MRQQINRRREKTKEVEKMARKVTEKHPKLGKIRRQSSDISAGIHPAGNLNRPQLISVRWISIISVIFGKRKWDIRKLTN